MAEKSFSELEIERKIGYVFKDKSLLYKAFVHRSFLNENPHIADGPNERLEFLGDSVLGLIAAEYLFRHLPKTSEGILSELRSRWVEASACASFVQKLDLASHLLLGKGEKMNAGKGRESILADLFEAIIGAIFLDGGLQKAQDFFFSHFQKEIEEILVQPVKNWKAELQEFSQKKYQKIPVYEVIEESGPPHQKHFRIAVLIDQNKIGEGEGSSKKEAQQKAAAAALSHLKDAKT